MTDRVDGKEDSFDEAPEDMEEKRASRSKPKANGMVLKPEVHVTVLPPSAGATKPLAPGRAGRKAFEEELRKEAAIKYAAFRAALAHKALGATAVHQVATLEAIQAEISAIVYGSEREDSLNELMLCEAAQTIREAAAAMRAISSTLPTRIAEEL